MLVYVLVLIAVLGALLAGQSTLATGVAGQTARNVRADEAAVLAESAVDEYLARLAVEANGGEDGATISPIFSNCVIVAPGSGRSR